MNAIEATWTNGRIEPLGPVEWPEGCRLMVEPLLPAEFNGSVELEGDGHEDPAALAEWVERVGKLKPTIWDEGERERYESYCEASRQFNLEAVRQQMEQLPKGMTVPR